MLKVKPQRREVYEMSETIMNTEEIMTTIKAGLSGEPKQDYRYLAEQLEQYRFQDAFKVLSRECGKIIWNMMPECEFEEDRKTLEPYDSVDDVLDAISIFAVLGDTEQAIKIGEALVSRLENAHAYEDDEENEYVYFNEPFQEFLYCAYNNSDKHLRMAAINYPAAYLYLGSQLFEAKRFKDARDALRAGLRWNPNDFRMLSEYIETYKAQGELDEFFVLSKESFNIAYRPVFLARCFRNLGWYFTEKKLWSEAVGTYVLSSEYDPASLQIENELEYITSIADNVIKEPDFHNIADYCEKYDFPIGPSHEVIYIAYTYGDSFRKRGKNNLAKYCFEILYRLTKSEEVKEWIDQLNALN